MPLLTAVTIRSNSHVDRVQSAHITKLNNWPHASSSSWQVANASSLTRSTDRYGDCILPCAGFILQDKLAIYEESSVQAGYLQLHMQLPARGSPCDSLTTLGIAVLNR